MTSDLENQIKTTQPSLRGNKQIWRARDNGSYRRTGSMTWHQAPSPEKVPGDSPISEQWSWTCLGWGWRAKPGGHLFLYSHRDSQFSLSLGVLLLGFCDCHSRATVFKSLDISLIPPPSTETPSLRAPPNPSDPTELVGFSCQHPVTKMLVWVFLGRYLADVRNSHSNLTLHKKSTLHSASGPYPSSQKTKRKRY